MSDDASPRLRSSLDDVIDTYKKPTDLLPHARPIELLGVKLLCLDLETLISVERAAGPPKDLEVVAELEALREERDSAGDERGGDFA